MNKAEEQYLYQMGRTKAQNDIMFFALTWKAKDDLIVRVKNVIERNEIDNVKILKSKMDEGISDYNSEILRLIYNNVITDWPSFITYMTGETYEKGVKDGI